ncbi:hypothetical protein GX645_05785 [Candidatus Sumerlaeota bacterium]|nr:hypothetical protein [Candidatus Sumerlaeales bacterium]NLD61947.1 hypothetical protein [Candidatus Sumerlaeota bacterium]
MKKEILQRISKPRKTCIACQKPLQGIGAHPVAISGINGADLSDADPEEIFREDFCDECWGEAQKDKQVLAKWMGKQEQPKPSKLHTRRERAAVLTKWFDALQATERTLKRDQYLYVIAHLLMKYQVLKWEKSSSFAEASPTEQPKVSFKTQDDDIITVDAVPLDPEINQAIIDQMERFFAGKETIQNDFESTDDDTNEAPNKPSPN